MAEGRNNSSRDEDRGGRRGRRGGRDGRPKTGPSNKAQPDPDKARLFLGAEISTAAVEDLTELVESMQPTARAEALELRWLPPATYHITLKFLGWSQREVVSAIRDVGTEALRGVKGFDFIVHGVGAFPKPEKARVLWAGVDKGADLLSDLAGRLDEATEAIGFPREKRSFHPHVTLARLKAPNDLQRLLLPFSTQVCRKSRLSRVVLFESFLKSSGSQYEKVAHWDLEPM
jgi:2'-5' RNA ligase